MRLFLSLSLLFFAVGASARVDSCGETLVSGPEASLIDRDRQLITNLLTEEGLKRGATLVGLIEARMANGDVILSKLYLSTEELGRPLETAQIQEFKRVLGSRLRVVIKLRSWIVAPRSGGLVIEDLKI